MSTRAVTARPGPAAARRAAAVSGRHATRPRRPPRLRARRLRRPPRRAVAGRRAPAAGAHRPGPPRDGRRDDGSVHLLGFIGREPAFAEPRRPSARARPGLLRRWAGTCTSTTATSTCTRPARQRPAAAGAGTRTAARQNLEIESDPRPRLSVKVAWFLSDVSRARPREPPGDPRQPPPEPPSAPGLAGGGPSPARRRDRGARRPRHGRDLRPAPVACARREPLADGRARALFLAYTYRWVRAARPLSAVVRVVPRHSPPSSASSSEPPRRPTGTGSPPTPTCRCGRG